MNNESVLKKFTLATRELSMIRNALDHSAIVAITDHLGNIIHVNDKFCEISKYSNSELLGKNHRIINSGFHEKGFFSEMWKMINHGKVWEGEIKNKAKDGSFYWVKTTIVPFLNEEQRPYQFVSIRFDITQRKNAEEQLSIYTEKLEQNNRAILDRESQILVQDRLASLGLLASSLAHEIGTPLGVIRGRAEYLEMQIGDNPDVKKNVGVIVSQIDRVSKLIRSLLNLARGDRAHHLGQVNINTVVSEVTELMGHELRKHNIEIINRLDTNIPTLVHAESGPFHQVILNLLVNSVHAIESAIRDGRNKNHFISISSETKQNNIHIQIEDSGCGISEKNMKNIFKPFFTTKDIGVGTGLGLATSYRIVESWGGSIIVKSTEGAGTEFCLILAKATES